MLYPLGFQIAAQVFQAIEGLLAVDFHGVFRRVGIAAVKRVHDGRVKSAAGSGIARRGGGGFHRCSHELDERLP